MDHIICRPVMLPASDTQVSDKDQLYIPLHDPNSKYQIRLSTVPNSPTSMRKECQRQHLYLVSDKPIKEGDWVLWDNKQIYKVLTSFEYSVSRVEKKIEATTDKSLGLPLIPEQWIRDVYVPAQGKIDKTRVKFGLASFDGYDVKRGEVIILPIKDNYNREEVKAILEAYDDDISAKKTYNNSTGWFDKNY